MIILDFGSGETCRNDRAIVSRMIHSLARVDTRKEIVVIKWQLFEDIPPLRPLSHSVFDFAYRLAAEYGYETTASVFDKPSLDFLCKHDVPFVKIACVPELYRFAFEIDGPVVVSVGNHDDYELMQQKDIATMCCLREYPASATKYEVIFSGLLHYGLSDHTTDWYLFNKYEPLLYEKHFCLPDAEGPDAGPFAARPEQLKEIL